MAFNRFDHSLLGELRPRFQLRIQSEPETSLQHIAENAKQDPTVTAVKVNNYVFLKIPKHHQHYWSPELSVRIEKAEFKDQITVYCLLGPSQSVWMLFMFFYAFVICCSIFGGIFGLVSYQSSGDTSWLWVIPTGIVIGASIFISSKIGQNKGRDQMLHLVSFLYHHLAEISDVERIKD